MTPDTPAPAEPETITVADEVAVVLNEVLDSAEAFTTAGVKVPFAAARILVDKARLLADSLETQLRKAAGR